MAQQQKNPVESCEENPEKEDTIGMQEVVPDTQVGDSIEGQGSGEEIPADKIAYWELSFRSTRSCLESQES